MHHSTFCRLNKKCQRICKLMKTIQFGMIVDDRQLLWALQLLSSCSECLDPEFRFMLDHLEPSPWLPWRQTHLPCPLSSKELVQPTVIMFNSEIKCCNIGSECTLWVASWQTFVLRRHHHHGRVLRYLLRLPEEEDLWGPGLPQGHPAVPTGPWPLRGVGHADWERCQGASCFSLLRPSLHQQHLSSRGASSSSQASGTSAGKTF